MATQNLFKNLQETRQKTILLFDDDEFIRELAAIYFELEGFSVVVKANIENALDEVRQLDPDIIILDLIFPNANGLTLLEELKLHTDTKHIPVLVLTAYSHDWAEKRCIELGADAYLVKPVSTEILMKTIKSLLEKNESAAIKI